MTLRLGDLLVQRGVLTVAQRDEVLRLQRTDPRPFGAIAERMFGVVPARVEEAWAEQFSGLTSHVDPRREPVDPRVLPAIDRRQAWQFRVLPLREEGGDLVLCTTREHLVRALKFTGWRIARSCHFVLAEPLALGEALMRHYRLDGMTPEMVAGRGLAVP
ncbi:MAG: hypothetical protein ACKVU4_05985 [Phycisphaerales bacterium]